MSSLIKFSNLDLFLVIEEPKAFWKDNAVTIGIGDTIGNTRTKGKRVLFKRKCSVTNQPQSKKWYGLVAPGDQTVDSNMSDDEKQFCNITESLMYKCMKSAMPLR
eukprot:2254494-Ditylum_brightwellii.AAC.1